MASPQGTWRGAPDEGILSLFLGGAVNNEDETTLILVAGKAPRQTAHCVCRLARCVCRSSSQKVLRYFLGALYMRSPFPLKKGEGMKREGACLSIRTAQDFSTWSVALLLPSVEMTISSCHPERARECAGGRTAGFSLPHGKSQPPSRRDFREPSGVKTPDVRAADSRSLPLPQSRGAESGRG